jgi:hypothetical protein
VARIVRPMRIAAADPTRPLVGDQSKCLGVRTSGKYADVGVDGAGNVVVNGQGMSVSADWRTLPKHLIPEELADEVDGASGVGMAVFVHGQGTGPFAEGPMAAGLEVRFKPASAVTGNVCPMAAVALAQYQADLAATRPAWVIDPS